MFRFAVFGNPISHSLSPQIHQQFAKQCELYISYQKIYAPIDTFEQAIDDFRGQDGHGANITLPFKQSAAKYADHLTDRAKQANAVNTFIFRDNQCIGDNTDGIGLLRDLERLNISITNKHLAILGAGGAAYGIIPALQTASPARISILNRTQESAVKLATAYNCHIFENGNELIDVLINTTSANFDDDLIFSGIKELSLTDCYDLNYGARHQSFAQWAQAKRAKSCHDGLGMLIEQAAESFYAWTGHMPFTGEQKNLFANINRTFAKCESPTLRDGVLKRG